MLLGSGTLIVEAGTPFYAQGLNNRGVVNIAASLDGFTDALLPIQLAGVGILLSATQHNPYGGSIFKEDGPYTTLFSGTTAVNLNFALVDPDNAGYPNWVSHLTLLPGMDPSIAVQSTNPAVGTIQRSPVRIDQPGPSGSVFVDFQLVGLGDTEVAAVPPPGFTVPAGPLANQNGRILFHVRLPGWDIGQLSPLGKDTTRQAPLNLAANVLPLTTDVPITLQSSDPSRLLLSRDGAAPGSPAIAMTLPADARFAGAFYLHALDNQGTVRLNITAPGFADTYFDIPLTR